MKQERIHNLPYDICLSAFDMIFLNDSSHMRKLVHSSASIGRFNVIDVLISYMLDGNIDKFRDDGSESVASFFKQADTFLAVVSAITLLRTEDDKIVFYSPKSRVPCLCKIGSAIVRESAPNFYRNPRSLCDYINTRYMFSEHGKNNAKKACKLLPEMKMRQFDRLLKQYKVIKVVRDFDGVNWVESSSLQSR